MPRIRKKTSNRVSTNTRNKVQHKVRETRKKKAKAAKKNPQWKSKHKKDPGIPNNFPYKDQILAEVAEQRRIAAEEKQRRKDEKKAGRQNQVDEGEAGSDNDEVMQDKTTSKSLDVGLDGIASVSAKHLTYAKTRTKEAVAPVQVEEEDDDIPVLYNRDLPNFQAVLDEADVIIQVLDARDPLPFRSSHLEELVAAKPGQRILFVLNKIDTCPREAVAGWTNYLRTQHPTVLFRSASAFLPSALDTTTSKGQGKQNKAASDATGAEAILTILEKWGQQKGGERPLAVAVLGVTNVGKSSLINSLLEQASLPIYTLSSSSRSPSTTTLCQEVTLDRDNASIRFIDTPGFVWEADGPREDNLRAQDVLLRSKGRIDRLKDPVPVVAHIVARANAEDLMLFYNLPAFSKGDPEAFLAGLARSHRLVKKRGELDVTGACRIILRDWSTGKLPRYATPPTSSSPVSELRPELESLYASDDTVLSALPTRRDMRRLGGLVKLTPGEVDTRKIAIGDSWTGFEESDGGESSDSDADAPNSEAEQSEEESGSEDDEGEDESAEELEADDDNDEDDNDETGEEFPFPSPPPSHKQKRKHGATSLHGPPPKRVAFAPRPAVGSNPKTTAATATTLQTKVMKSALKANQPKRTKKSSVGATTAMRKVANMKNKSRTTKPSSESAGTAYDFGKFF